MTAGTFLVALTLVVLVLLLWHLRWVLLVLFGAVVVAVALDVLIVQLQKRTRLQRPQALAAVLGVLLLAGGLLGQLLVPELISQFQQLSRDLPQLFNKVSDLLSSEPRLAQLNEAVGEGLNLKGLQPLLGFAGGAANSLIQLFLMSLLAILLALDPRAHRHMVVAVTHHRVSAHLGRSLTAQSAPGPVECPDLRPAHFCTHHWPNGGDSAADRVGSAPITAVDGVGTGVPAGAAEPGGVSAHTVVVAQNRQSVAHRGFNRSAEPWRPVGASWGSTGPSPGGSASGADAARGGAADHGSLGVKSPLQIGLTSKRSDNLTKIFQTPETKN